METISGILFLVTFLTVETSQQKDVLPQCGRTECALGVDSMPFIANQRCSCSIRCSIFGDCCPDFRSTSKNYFLQSRLKKYINADDDFDQIKCDLPSHLTSSHSNIKFTNSVPPFHLIEECPEGSEELDIKGGHKINPFITKWPIIDISTGIVYSDIFTAQCNSKHNGSNGFPIGRGPFKYWPSFRILCQNRTVTGRFNPFNAKHAQILLEQDLCAVELTHPKNPVMVPISFCAPLTVFGNPECTDVCVNGTVKIVAIYPQFGVESPPQLYRNAECAKCLLGNEVKSQLNCSFNLTNGLQFHRSKMRTRLMGGNPTTSFFWEGSHFNTFQLMMDFSWDPDDIFFPEEDSESEEKECPNENEVYVPFLDSCHQISVNEDRIINIEEDSNSANCFLEIQPKSDLNYSIYQNGTLSVKSINFDRDEYELNDNGSIIIRYCFDALRPSDDDRDQHAGEVPVRDIISRFITLGFMIFSVVSLSFLLFIYGLFPQLRNIPGKVVMNLAASLAVALALYSIGVLAMEKIWYPLCFCMAFVVHYGFLCTFSFCLCLAYDIYRTFSNKSSSATAYDANRIFLKYCLFGWGAPFIIVSISVFLEFVPNIGILSMPRPRYAMPVSIIHPTDFHSSGYHEHAVWICWIMNEKAVILYFKLPILGMLIANAVFFGMTIYQIKKASQHSAVAGRGRSMGLKRRLFIYLKLSTIMGMTWLFGFLAAASRIEALWIPFGLANSLQGVYITLAFVFNKKVARLLRGWAAGETSRENIDPRRYASTSAGSMATSTVRRS